MIPRAEKTAFLVLGPESSGTRFWMENLLACGCAGSAAHDQPWDDQLPDLPVIAWRRSCPHGAKWPDLATLVGSLREMGYATRAFFTTREWHATASSQVEHGHVKNYEQALLHIRRATSEIPSALQALNIQWLTVQYEALHPREYVWRLLETFGLTFQDEAPAFSNQNDKYYFAAAGPDT